MSSEFATLVEEELRRARGLHAPLHSLHEGYAVLLEEVDELWAAVKRRGEWFNQDEVLAELVQVAAMAQRMSEDCGLLAAQREEGAGR